VSNQTADVAPEIPAGPPQAIITFGSWSQQRAFADWVASGECIKALWAWMGRHGYHV
jgi:hypothetical protein